VVTQIVRRKLRRIYPFEMRKNQKGGVALILVIWLMVVLIAIVGEFSYSMRTEINITKNFKEEEEAYQLALAGIERAKLEIISAKMSSYIYLNKDGILVFGGGEESPERKGELEKGTFSYSITDEDGKLNINTASLQQLNYIIKGTGVDITEVDTIVDSVFDWRDTDNLHMLNGAEDDYYQSLENPYSCKDGLFDIIDELLLVKGVAPQIFYGTNEKEAEKGYEGIAQYLTTWGSGLININTAPRKVLEAVFAPPVVENIINQRETAPFLNPALGGIVNSSFFTIISTGAAHGGKIKRTVKMTIKRGGEKLVTLYWNDNFYGQI